MLSIMKLYLQREDATREARAAWRSLEERNCGAHGVECKFEGL